MSILHIGLEKDYLLRIRIRNGKGAELISHLPIATIETDDYTVDFSDIFKEIFRLECLRERCNAEYDRTKNVNLLSAKKNGYELAQWQIYLIVVNNCPFNNVESTRDKKYWCGLDCSNVSDFHISGATDGVHIECEWLTKPVISN